MNIYNDGAFYFGYLEDQEVESKNPETLKSNILDQIDLNDPTLSNEKIKQVKEALDQQVKLSQEKEIQRIADNAAYIGVSVEEYLEIMKR